MEATASDAKRIESIQPLPGNVADLKKVFEGQIAEPGTTEYEQSRVAWNKDSLGWPSAIATVASEKDVVSVVNYARENNCNLCIASGRHSFVCMLNDTLVLDMSQMKKITFDKDAMTITVQPGIKLGDVDKLGADNGVVVPCGTNHDTGIAGVGFLCRKYGLTIDNLLSVRVVLASGELVVASETENPDLFWGTRGGGGNFGVVTEFTFRCHPIGPEVLAGSKVYIINSLPFFNLVMANKFDILKQARDYCVLSILAKPLVMPSGGPIVICWSHCGTLEEGQKEYEKFEMPFTPLDDIKPVSFHMGVQKFSEGPKADQLRSGYYFEKGALFETLSDDCLKTIVPFTNDIQPDGGAEGFIIVTALGGAMGDVPADATAFEQRNAKFWALIIASWKTPDQREGAVAWVRKVYAAVQPYSSGSYAPVIGADITGMVWDSNVKRLIELKQKYDPTNLFKNNRNIPPNGK